MRLVESGCFSVWLSHHVKNGGQFLYIMISIENSSSDSGDHSSSYSSSFRGLLGGPLEQGSRQDIRNNLTPNRVR